MTLSLALIRVWATAAFKYGKRIATLEERISELEKRLEKQPPEACPFCGELGMRMTDPGRLLGDQGKQWWQETWTCEKCSKRQTRHHKL